jgi:hypothetical protein
MVPYAIDKGIINLMISQFNDIQDMKNFVEYLSSEMKSLGKSIWVDELKFFLTNTYTTSSEYLGELRIVLNRLLIEIGGELLPELQNNIRLAIKAINKAFS